MKKFRSVEEYEEYLFSPKDLDTFFNEEIKPFTRKEPEVSSKKIKISLFFITITLVSCLLLLFFAPLPEELKEILGRVLLMLFLALSFALFFLDTPESFDPHRSFYAMAELFEVIHPSFVYSPRKHLLKKTLQEAKLFPFEENTTLKGKNLVTGKINGTEIFFSYITIQQPKGIFQQKDGFSGAVYYFYLDQNFDGTTVILPKKSREHIEGLHEIKATKGAHRDFQEHFSLHTNNEYHAKLLVTPAFKKTILEFSQKHKKDIRISLHENRLLIAIPSKKDPFVFRPTPDTTKKDVKNYLDKIYEPISLMEKFKNNLYL